MRPAREADRIPSEPENTRRKLMNQDFLTKAKKEVERERQKLEQFRGDRRQAFKRAEKRCGRNVACFAPSWRHTAEPKRNRSASRETASAFASRRSRPMNARIALAVSLPARCPGFAAEPDANRRALRHRNQDIAPVREEREWSLAGGRSTLRYADVAAQIDPTSVHLVPASGATSRSGAELPVRLGERRLAARVLASAAVRRRQGRMGD